MKPKFLLVALILLCSMSATSFAQVFTSDHKKAFELVKYRFRSQDVDYYYLDADTHFSMSNVWTFFVDAEPMKGWEHECYIVTVPKNLNPQTENYRKIKCTKMSLPPSDQLFIPINPKNRYGINAEIKPLVRQSTLTNEDLTAAQRTYAIILSGGINRYSNYERYWNDCSFIYQTLVNKYGVPKENIYPIMSDGQDPMEDMRKTTGGFASQSLDLDFDGVNDIKLAATKANVQSTMNKLANILQKDDHLFIYVIDHGSSDDELTNSYICLWGGEKLYDTELADMITPFSNKFVNVNVLLGQCYSGGFVDNLTKTGCVVAAASTGSESSWSCPDIPYDEFVYHWTCAVNGADHEGTLKSADSDGNGRVTMQEAFEFAKNNDRWPDEHPQYVSTPASVGEDLAFNHLAPSVDLYIKDGWDDTGKEPNYVTKEYWMSPSIWTRNQDDSINVYQNPEYTPDHQMAYIYVYVHNRGKETYKGKTQWLQMYWAIGSTYITPKAWRGLEIKNDGGYVTGGKLDAVSIKNDILPGDSSLIRVRWLLPDMLADEPEGNYHFCLYAKIMDEPTDTPYDPKVTMTRNRERNNEAQKNLTIVRRDELFKGASVYVRNNQVVPQNFTLELQPLTAADATLFSIAKVQMELSPAIYDAWQRGGHQSNGIVTPTSGVRTIDILTPQSQLKSINLNGGQFDAVKLKFDFRMFPQEETNYTINLVQKDEDGNIIGGETFIVESPIYSEENLNITSTPMNNGEVQLGVDRSQYNEVRWLNERGDIIGNAETVKVTPKAGNSKFTVQLMTEKGEVVGDSIMLDGTYGIKAVNASTNLLEVTLNDKAPAHAKILISSVTDGARKITENVSAGTNTVNINTSKLQSGLYVAGYYVDNELIDQKKINIQH